MRTLVFIITFLLFFTSCEEKNDPLLTCGERYFYNQGEKTFVNEIYTKAVISFYDTLDAICVHDVLSDFPQLSYSANENYNRWVIVDISSNSCSETEEILSSVRQKDEVTDCNMWLVGNTGDGQGVTAKFWCKFLHDSLEYKLAGLMEETNTQYLRKIGGLHFIRADKNSIGDAIDMANYFYETGFFEYAAPSFLVSIIYY